MGQGTWRCDVPRDDPIFDGIIGGNPHAVRDELRAREAVARARLMVVLEERLRILARLAARGVPVSRA